LAEDSTGREAEEEVKVTIFECEREIKRLKAEGVVPTRPRGKNDGSAGARLWRLITWRDEFWGVL